jgi:hypothetical protein
MLGFKLLNSKYQAKYNHGILFANLTQKRLDKKTCCFFKK